LGNVGLMHWRFAELDQAAKLYRQSTDVLDALVRDFPKPAEYRQQCAFSHYQLGRTLRSWGIPKEPEKEFRVAIALYEGLLSETPGRLNICTELASGYYALMKAIAPGPEAQMLYQKLAVCAEAACKPFLAPSRLTTRPAEQAHREAEALQDIASYVLEPPGSVSCDHQLVIRMGRAITDLEPSYTGGWVVLARGHHLAGDWNAAEAAFRKAADVMDKPYDATPTAPALFKLLKVYRDLMIELMTEGKSPQLGLAERVHQEALKVVSGAPAELRANPDVRREIGHLHRFWAGILEGAGRMEEAEQAFSDAQSVFDKLVTDDPGLAGNWHFAADTRYRFAMLMISRGRKQEAEQMLRRAIEIHELREAKFPSYSEPSRDRERVACYNRLAWILANAHSPEQRDPVYAVKLAAKAVEIESDQSAWWTTLGIAHYRAGEWMDAIEALKKSTDLHTTEVGGFNDFFLAMAHWQLGDKDESLRCYDRAVAWMENNASKDKRLDEFRAEATELLGVRETNDEQKTEGR
jgi:tetratricopeptide (TPR) repeat protein